MANKHEAYCPNCLTTICLRCIVLDAKMDPDGLDGCSECERHLKRVSATKRKHIELDHARAATQATGEGGERD